MEDRLINIMRLFYNNFETKDPEELDRILYVIMANSTMAISFVAAIEEEFNIDIEDEDVNLTNFLRFGNILSIISRYKNP